MTNTFYKLIHPSFLGPLLIQWSDQGLEKMDIQTADDSHLSLVELALAPKWLQAFIQDLDLYLKKGQPISELPPINETRWTAFQKEIYLQLFATKPGQTLTYGKLAEICARPKAARSVGAAMSRNTLPILIPCHRVLPAGGKLGNYTGGEGPLSKEKLLNFEKSFSTKNAP